MVILKTCVKNAENFGNKNSFMYGGIKNHVKHKGEWDYAGFIDGGWALALRHTMLKK